MKIYLAVVLLVLALVDHSVAAVSVEQIVDILDYAGVLPHSSLSASVPEMEGIDSEQEHVKRCYSSAVGNQSIDIFAGKAGLIIHQIVTEFKEEIFPTDDLHGRIKTIVENIRVLAKIIKECIASPEQDQVQYGVTSMSILSSEEYSVMSNGLKSSKESYPIDESYSYKCDNTDLSKLPDTYDLRDYGYVSPVKNQGQCGSCYAFAAVGAMESQHMKKHHFKSFSEQAFVNCNGCDGGQARAVYTQAIERGIALEHDIPYVIEKEDCRDYESYKKLKWFCYRISYKKLSDDAIRSFIYYYGAVAGVIDANGKKFKYTKGKYNGEECDDAYESICHAILIVGWTEDSWIIKNSWGTKWGDNGYVYMKRGTCSINHEFSVPLFE